MNCRDSLQGTGIELCHKRVQVCRIIPNLNVSLCVYNRKGLQTSGCQLQLLSEHEREEFYKCIRFSEVSTNLVSGRLTIINLWILSFFLSLFFISFSFSFLEVYMNYE